MIFIHFTISPILCFLGNIQGDNVSIPPRLKELHNRLVVITTEYRNLLDMFMSFFSSLQEVRNPLNIH